MFKVRCKEDISEVFAVYDVCRFRAQNKRQHLIVARGGSIKKER